MSDPTPPPADPALEPTELVRPPSNTLVDEPREPRELREERELPAPEPLPENTEITEPPSAVLQLEARSPLARLRALFPEAIGPIDHLVGALLGLVYVVWLQATARTLGFGRDEGVYFHAGADYARWFELLLKSPRRAIERSAIDPLWTNNHEHPALMKSLFGISWDFLHEKLHLFKDASDAFRLPGMMMGGLCLWVVYLFGARHFSRRAGLMSAALLALMIRVFFHAHLACFDVPIMTMWTLSIYVYWRACQTRGLGWAIASGLVYGLTLETKHNAWILPAVYLSHTAFVDGRRILRELSRGRISVPAQLVFIAILGPAIFILLWPWLWNDTLPRIQEYAEFHLNHEYYNIEFLHQNYFGPPSPKLYAPFLILATVPLVTLVLFFLGGGERLRSLARAVWPALKAFLKSQAVPRVASDDAGTDLLLFLALCAPIAPFFLPKTPIFGGTKHWMPAYPFLALFAGRGFDLTWTALRRAWKDGIPALKARAHLLPYAQAALVVLVLAAPLAEVGSFASVRSVGVHAHRRRHRGRRRSRVEPAVLGFHHRERRPLARGERSARLDPLHPRHRPGRLEPDDRREAGPAEPARRRQPERGELRHRPPRAPHGRGRRPDLDGLRRARSGVRAHPRRCPHRQRLPTLRRSGGLAGRHAPLLTERKRSAIRRRPPH